MNEKKPKEPECPLCEVSQETIEKLKKSKEEKPIKRKRKIFPKIFILILLLVLAGFAVYSFLSNFSSSPSSNKENKTTILNGSKTVAVGVMAPDFTSEDVDGNKISLSDFRNKKPILLVFWATWCGVCAKELPDLKVFTAKYKNEIQVIAPDSGESRETLKNYIKEKDVNFLILLDEDRKIWNQYLVRGTPSHFLIDSQGKIVTLRPGLALLGDLETMISMLTELW